MNIGKQANLHYGTVSETITSNLFVLTTTLLNDNVWAITRELLTRHTWNIARMSTNIIL
jgi:hypothetical protein